MHRFRNATAGCLTIVGCLVFSAGCQRQDQVTSYSIPKYDVLFEENHVDPEPSNIDMQADRMLGAIVPRGDMTWFFKLSGANETVSEHGKEFIGFIKSLTFEDDKPKWTLPEGWSQSGGSENSGFVARFATIEVGSHEPKLELTVTPLPNQGAHPQDANLANVNRWRGQLQLPAFADREQLAAATVELEFAGGTATMVNLVGNLGGGASPMRPPFAGGAAGGPVPPVRTSNPPPRPSLGYDTPKGWQQGRVGGIREAAFDVVDGEKKIEVTVFRLPASGLLANVNRWREQVMLPPVSEQQLQKDVTELKVGEDRVAKYVPMVGPPTATPRETILAAIIVDGESGWFFKLRGDVDLAAREEEHFKEFVQSVKINGAGDGN